MGSKRQDWLGLTAREVFEPVQLPPVSLDKLSANGPIGVHPMIRFVLRGGERNASAISDEKSRSPALLASEVYAYVARHVRRLVDADARVGSSCTKSSEVAAINAARTHVDPTTIMSHRPIDVAAVKQAVFDNHATVALCHNAIGARTNRHVSRKDTRAARSTQRCPGHTGKPTILYVDARTVLRVDGKRQRKTAGVLKLFRALLTDPGEPAQLKTHVRARRHDGGG